MTTRLSPLITACAAAAAAACAPSGKAAIPRDWRFAQAPPAVVADSAMVVTASPIATRIGVDVLKRGGNAIDAAVAVAFALEVAYPTAGNIGGGGFIVARMGAQSAALDFRETAPHAATRDMYLDAAGNPTDKSVTGALAVGVPGAVAGLFEAHAKYGSKPWKELVQPAIDLAANGFTADSAFVEGLRGDSARLTSFPATAALFFPGGKPVAVGDHWSNPDLTATLRRIADRGRDGFYTGPTADLIAAEMKRDGGIITTADLKAYQAEWRDPVTFTYRGHQVISMPPSSSGGLTVGLIAGILDGFDLRTMGWHSPQAIHTTADAEKLAYARRNTLLGDPAFVTVPTAAFLSPDTIAALRKLIGPRALAMRPPATMVAEAYHTTHFSVVDAHGDAVAMTTTLNLGHGSAVTVAGGGFLLNDEMDDFTAKVGAINQMGLRQGEANAIQPGKRMLSSMTPTIVLDSAGTPMLVTGAAGGAHIITAVVQMLSNVVDFGMPVNEAMAAPRLHAQDYPDSIWLEGGGYSERTVRALSALGYHPAVLPRGEGLAWAQSIVRAGGQWQGATEPRGHGLALGY